MRWTAVDITVLVAMDPLISLKSRLQNLIQFERGDRTRRALTGTAYQTDLPHQLVLDGAIEQPDWLKERAEKRKLRKANRPERTIANREIGASKQSQISQFKPLVSQFDPAGRTSGVNPGSPFRHRKTSSVLWDTESARAMHGIQVVDVNRGGFVKKEAHFPKEGRSVFTPNSTQRLVKTAGGTIEAKKIGDQWVYNTSAKSPIARGQTPEPTVSRPSFNDPSKSAQQISKGSQPVSPSPSPVFKEWKDLTSGERKAYASGTNREKVNPKRWMLNVGLAQHEERVSRPNTAKGSALSDLGSKSGSMEEKMVRARSEAAEFKVSAADRARRFLNVRRRVLFGGEYRDRLKTPQADKIVAEQSVILDRGINEARGGLKEQRSKILSEARADLERSGVAGWGNGMKPDDFKNAVDSRMGIFSPMSVKRLRKGEVHSAMGDIPTDTKIDSVRRDMGWDKETLHKTRRRLGAIDRFGGSETHMTKSVMKKLWPDYKPHAPRVTAPPIKGYPHYRKLGKIGVGLAAGAAGVAAVAGWKNRAKKKATEMSSRGSVIQFAGGDYAKRVGSLAMENFGGKYGYRLMPAESFRRITAFKPPQNPVRVIKKNGIIQPKANPSAKIQLVKAGGIEGEVVNWHDSRSLVAGAIRKLRGEKPALFNQAMKNTRHLKPKYSVGERYVAPASNRSVIDVNKIENLPADMTIINRNELAGIRDASRIQRERASKFQRKSIEDAAAHGSVLKGWEKAQNDVYEKANRIHVLNGKMQEMTRSTQVAGRNAKVSSLRAKKAAGESRRNSLMIAGAGTAVGVGGVAYGRRNPESKKQRPASIERERAFQLSRKGKIILFKEKEMNPYVMAGLSGGASGAVLGSLAGLTRGTSRGKVAGSMLGMGLASAGIVGGGSLIGSKIMGKPRDDEGSAFTRRAALGGAIAGAGLGAIGGLALRSSLAGKLKWGRAAQGWLKKAAETSRPAHLLQRSPTAAAGALGAVGGGAYGLFQGLDEGQQVDSIRNIKKDIKKFTAKPRGIIMFNQEVPQPQPKKRKFTENRGTHKYLNQIKEGDFEKGVTNMRRSIIAGGLVGGLFRKRLGVGMARGVLIGAGTGAATQAGVRMVTSRTRDEYGDKPIKSKLAEKLPYQVGGLVAAGTIINRVGRVGERISSGRLGRFAKGAGKFMFRSQSGVIRFAEEDFNRYINRTVNAHARKEAKRRVDDSVYGQGSAYKPFGGDDKYTKAAKRIKERPRRFAKSVEEKMGRGKRLIHDIKQYRSEGSVTDSRGRPRKPEWQKPWVASTAITAGVVLAGAAFLGGRRFMKTSADKVARGVANDTINNIAAAVDSGNAVRAVKNAVKSKLGKEVAGKKVGFIEGLGQDTRRFFNKRLAPVEDFINKNTKGGLISKTKEGAGFHNPAKQAEIQVEIDNAREIARDVRAGVDAAQVRNNKINESYSLLGRDLKGRKQKDFSSKVRTIRFAQIVDDWSTRDARGNSVRVYAPDSQQRTRRNQKWYEKKKNQQIMAIAGIPTALGAGALGRDKIMKVGRRFKDFIINPSVSQSFPKGVNVATATTDLGHQYGPLASAAKKVIRHRAA